MVILTSFVLLRYSESLNPANARQVRRWGIAGCVRNCCFEELDQAWLLHEVKVVPHLLMRLSDDADEYDFDEKVKLASNIKHRGPTLLRTYYHFVPNYKKRFY